ncbi:MAG: gamma-glutamyl-gamma-aminobutyrate hydrolase [Candidatus Nephthysia bennettiae]|nr:gamma-glutamyl-gamma-aminobutyrate hydrolase family protein [Candidatus Dormibacteraeota bacterium]PZR86611.1 MAG: gamma-glutamyl-gamma-aminobutyrate hydrolase [Candidatus Dormibacteraeota bacterium]
MGAAARPRVAITYSPKRPDSYYEPYVRAVAGAGAEPVLVPATPALHLEMTRMLQGVDGLLLPGGWDMDPALYGEPPVEVLGTTDVELDRAEIEAATEAMAIELPVLGICRGQQVLNVALGGTLHQHVEGHDGRGQPRDRLAHPIRVERDSELARAAGGAEVMVNSLHHQAVKELGSGLQVSATSPDGVIEGVEHREAVVAVQCHPEELVEKSEWAQALLQRFVERASRARQRTC